MEIIFQVLKGNNGDIGLINLNRPQALNALNAAMTLQLYEKLKEWRSTATIKAVVIKSNHSRAFCAGGDIKEIYEYKSHTGEPFREYFWHEYRLNQLIATYPKPYIALMDGITMGGGVGVSVHAKFRIVTERTVFAMPETTIGFFPDIGASYFLSRCPGQTGIYLALTGARIHAADTQYLGLSDFYLHSSDLDKLLPALTEDQATDINSALFQKFCSPEETALIEKYRAEIDSCFSFTTIEAILAALHKNGSVWCRETADLLLTKSPTSLKVTLAQMQRGAQLSLADCLQMEYRIATHMLDAPDIYEGVRATLIHKDRRPKWQPATLGGISTQTVASYFEKLKQHADLLFDQA